MSRSPGTAMIGMPEAMVRMPEAKRVPSCEPDRLADLSCYLLVPFSCRVSSTTRRTWLSDARVPTGAIPLGDARHHFLPELLGQRLEGALPIAHGAAVDDSRSHRR